MEPRSVGRTDRAKCRMRRAERAADDGLVVLVTGEGDAVDPCQQRQRPLWDVCAELAVQGGDGSPGRDASGIDDLCCCQTGNEPSTLRSRHKFEGPAPTPGAHLPGG